MSSLPMTVAPIPASPQSGPQDVDSGQTMTTGSPFDYAIDWPRKQNLLRQRVEEIPDDWFRVPYRTRDEAVEAAFGSECTARHLLIHADIALSAVLLTPVLTEENYRTTWMNWGNARILSVFPEARWYPHPDKGVRGHGRVRDRRRVLRDMVNNAVHAPSLAGLVLRYGHRVEAGNPQAQAYIPALFDVWLDEQDIRGDEADGLRLLSGLSGGIATARQIMWAPRQTTLD